jgi:transcriptional regulator with XRE-family HTH domain
MNKIKKRRIQLGFTQKELAAKMGTTQQTIARWENENSSPSIRTLHELADALETTSSALLGHNFFGAQTTRYYATLNNQKKKGKDELSGFWGHIGILPVQKDKSVWYPITEEAMQIAYTSFQGSQIFTMPTLNNKIIAINPKNVKRVVFSWEPCDPFFKDWELKWHENGIYPLEFFDILENLALSIELDDASYLENIPSRFLEGANQLMDDEKLTTKEIFEITTEIRVIYNDRKIENYTVEDYSKASMFIENITDLFENETIPLIFTTSGNEDIFIFTSSVAIIEFPLNKIEQQFLSEEDNI